MNLITGFRPLTPFNEEAPHLDAILTEREMKIQEVTQKILKIDRETNAIQLTQDLYGKYLFEGKPLKYSLAYLTVIDKEEGSPFTKEEEKAFQEVVKKSATTENWLHPKRAIPAFIGPGLLTATTFVGLSALIPLYQNIITVIAGFLQNTSVGIAGWMITGTNPDASSTAKDTAQNYFAEIKEKYKNLAVHLLDTFESDEKEEKEFAEWVSSKISMSVIEEKLENQLKPLLKQDDSKLYKKEDVVESLKQAVAYVHSGGVNIPQITELKQSVEILCLKKEVRLLKKIVQTVVSKSQSTLV